MKTRSLYALWNFLLLLLLWPGGASAAGELLDFEALTAKITEAEEIYEIVDARNPAAQRDKRIPFARKYERNMSLDRGLVLVVADTDEQALAVAREISALPGREAVAVKGGADTWQRVIAGQPALQDGFTFGIPTNTCDPPVIIQHYRKK